MQGKIIDWDASIGHLNEIFAQLQEPLDQFLLKYPGLACERKIDGADPRTMQRGGRLRITLLFQMEGSTASKPIVIPKGGARGDIDQFVRDHFKPTRFCPKDVKRSGVAMYYSIRFKAGMLFYK